MQLPVETSPLGTKIKAHKNQDIKKLRRTTVLIPRLHEQKKLLEREDPSRGRAALKAVWKALGMQPSSSCCGELFANAYESSIFP